VTFAPELNDGQTVFVFGSNLAGLHYGGAARQAVEHWGATLHLGGGRMGQSYAIPTMDENFQPLPLVAIAPRVMQFIGYARQHSELRFLITAIGCGIAGHDPKDIAPLFHDAPDNCVLPEGW
jgi:hypothetical protein